MSTVNINQDKAGEKYWSKVWMDTQLPPAIDVSKKTVNNYLNLRFHQFFINAFIDHSTKNKTLLEVGCGNSVWLPHLAKHFGLQVDGLDYSEHGCEQSRKILEREKVNGQIFLGDLFNPPAQLLGKYDFVLSMGVAEHFQSTSGAIKALSRMLKPGGVLITTIPNNAGVIGFLHKLLNRPVYDIHVPLDKQDLNQAVNDAELTTLYSKYLISVSFYLNLEGKEKPIKFYWLKKVFALGLSSVAKLIWMMEAYFTKSLPETKLMSAGIVNVAQKNLITTKGSNHD